MRRMAFLIVLIIFWSSLYQASGETIEDIITNNELVNVSRVEFVGGDIKYKVNHARGGAIRYRLESDIQGELNLEESVFKKNLAGDDGGAVSTDGKGTGSNLVLRVNDCQFEENVAKSSKRGNDTKLLRPAN